MSLIGRYAGLALAALLTLLITFAHFRGGADAIPATAPAPAVAPPQPVAAAAKLKKKKARRKLAAKLVVKPAAPAKIRGARLRDKGEALGGGTPDRVDDSTGTSSVQ